MSRSTKYSISNYAFYYWKYNYTNMEWIDFNENAPKDRRGRNKFEGELTRKQQVRYQPSDRISLDIALDTIKKLVKTSRITLTKDAFIYSPSQSAMHPCTFLLCLV